MKVTRPFNLQEYLADPHRPIRDSQGNPVSIVYVNFEPGDGEKPVLCVAHRPEGKASAWVTEDGKLNKSDKEAAIFFEYEEVFPGTEDQVRFPGWRPAKG